MTLCPILTYDKQNMAVSGGIFSGVCSPLRYSGAVFITLAMTRFASILELSTAPLLAHATIFTLASFRCRSTLYPRKNTG